MEKDGKFEKTRENEHSPKQGDVERMISFGSLEEISVSEFMESTA